MKILFKNIKGIELALNSVVMMIILLIALIVIVGFFLGSTGQTFGPIASLMGNASTILSEKIGGIQP